MKHIMLECFWQQLTTTPIWEGNKLSISKMNYVAIEHTGNEAVTGM